jgi:nitrite reductase (NO-forming)
MVAHAVINLLGWIGITAIGTLVSLWPTMLRTRIATGAERAARLGLPALVLGVVAAAAGPLLDVPVLLTGGLALYLAGLALHAQGWVRAARSRPPVSFAPLSVGAALVWLVGCLVTLTVASAVTSSWGQLDRLLDELSPMLAIGFGAQLLVGALAYLVPVALGGGPTPVRVANAVLDRWVSARLVATNVGLLLTLLPLPGYARLAAAGLVLAALLTFLAVLPVAARRSRSARRETEIARGGR